MGILKNLFKSELTEPKDTVQDLVDEAIKEQSKGFFNQHFDNNYKVYKDEGYNSFETLLMLSFIYYGLEDTYVDISSKQVPFKHEIIKNRMIDTYNNTISVNNKDLVDKLRYVFDYARFLSLADRMLMYDNNDTEYIYSSISKNESKIQLIFDNYKIGFLFSKDIIKTDNDTNLLESFLSGEKDPTRYLVYMEINKDGYKKGFNLSIDDAELIYKKWSNEDKMLFNIAINNTIEYIKQSFDTIINESYRNYTGRSIEQNWKEYFESWT